MSLKLYFLVSVLCLIGTQAARVVQLMEKKRVDQMAIDWVEIQEAIPIQSESTSGTGCKCISNQCGCCAHLSVPVVKLDDTGCVNVTYLPSPQYGISFTFSLDGTIIFKYTVSAQNPPPVCFGIPKLTKLAGICLRFYNVTFTKSSLSACIRLEVNLKGLLVDKFELGCFKIPPSQKLLLRSVQKPYE
ncbi:uncharacterized protein LOC135464636 [Liolophura sinensis]|uniref:uncharacterized protein LOC135464636 n=1 Tax=Liolophura sinensis TaxID=3198878 RepID=UPI0031589A55